NRFRIRQAAGMLVETDRAIGDISERCGFVSDSYFGKMFKELMGCTPSSYRKGRITS
ncbi:MAG: helix-turn-helix domain-containing protein, partial [Lachnospiraceae bacterium]|nr:helix-turn-helix domain-containing protein [Lachnospiraceae bacterium]